MAMALEIKRFPPVNLADCMGIICNGEIEITDALLDKVQKCKTFIGVDGGLNHCKKMGIIPAWIVGDFDSVEARILEDLKKDNNAIVLPRAKDCTDLEAAIKKAHSISIYAQIVIWGGLGGRIDHTLGNIFLLFRHPGQVFLESEKQILFAISNTNKEVEIQSDTHTTLALFALNGVARDVTIKKEQEVIRVPLIDKDFPLLFPLDKKCVIHVKSGEILVILDQRKCHALKDLPKTEIPTKFSLDQPLTNILSYLTHQSLNFKTVQLFSDKERVFNIQPSSGEVVFKSKRGQTISLIPFHGPATDIKTKGLKWELGEERVSKLDKDFVGISNVSMGDEYSVQVSSGELLCIVNEELIDQELVEAKIN